MKCLWSRASCLAFLCALLASATAFAAPLEPGIGIPGDFELGAPFHLQVENFYRRHPRARREAPFHREGTDMVIPAFGLRFQLNHPADLITVIICHAPACHAPRYGLRMGHSYEMVAAQLGRPTRPYSLETPQHSIGQIWYYDYAGIGFDIQPRNGGRFIRAILVYPRRIGQFR